MLDGDHAAVERRHDEGGAPLATVSSPAGRATGLGSGPAAIRTPDQRVRVFISATLQELAPERAAARAAVAQLRLTPVLCEAGARAHPSRALYRAYLAQSDIFIGIYWQRYGWVAPAMDVSGLEEEYQLSREKPRLLYLKTPAPRREPRLQALLDRIRDEDAASDRLCWPRRPSGPWSGGVARRAARVSWLRTASGAPARQHACATTPLACATWPTTLARRLPWFKHTLGLRRRGRIPARARRHRPRRAAWAAAPRGRRRATPTACATPGPVRRADGPGPPLSRGGPQMP